jgi:hypothetical protein
MSNQRKREDWLMPIKIGLFFLSVFVLLPSLTHAISLREAADEAAIYFTKTAVTIDPSKKMVIQIVNYHSQKQDTDARKIETELYFALERQFPKFKLVLLSEAIAGVSGRGAVFVKGTYEKEGERTIVRLQAIKGSLSGIILAQTMVAFETKKSIRKSLVAVMDIEASDLKPNQRKAYSEIFRSALIQIGAFNLASSADIDKLNPDAIQQATGCTRDECATIIGEQLGVDRSISTTLVKLGESYYLLSSKILDIKDGSILTAKTLEHKEDLDTIKDSLEKLADMLVDQQKIVSPLRMPPQKIEPIKVTPQIMETMQITPPIEEPATEIEEDSGWPWWYWAIGVAVVGAIGVASSGSSDDSSSSSSGGGSGSTDTCPSGAGTCGSTTITW